MDLSGIRDRICLRCTAVAVLALLGLMFTVPMLDNGLPATEPVPDITATNGSANCTVTATGWRCSFDVPGTNPTRDAAIVDDHRTACQDQGGTWSCYGFCLPEYPHYCDFSFPDAGEPCIGSFQCSGACIADDSLPGTGSCSATPYRECDQRTRIEFGLAVPQTVICD